MTDGGGSDLRFSLRFLSGRTEGGEYVLDDSSEVVVGRSSDADLILVEGMVSRRHARFAMQGSTLLLEDLRSTNGTFVNGQKIDQRQLKEGDRVLIGTSIIKVVRTRAPFGTKPPPPDVSQITDDRTADRYRATGELDDMSVPELLEMFSSSNRDAVLEISGPHGVALITLANGRVLDCTIERLPDAPPEKAIQRALGYTKGSFVVRTYKEPAEPRLDQSVAELLVDGLFKLDELVVLRQRLPEAGAPLVMAKPLIAPLSRLDEGDLDILQLAHNAADVDAVLDETPMIDLEAAQRLLSLIERGYLRRG